MIVVDGVLSATSPAAPGTGVGTNAVQIGGQLQDCDSILFLASLVGATGGTLDVYIQHLVGGTWIDYAHFAQLTAGAGASKAYFAVSKYQNVAMTTTIGIDTSPALAANAIVGGPIGSAMRLLFVAGGGTSAGAAISVKVQGSSSNRG